MTPSVLLALWLANWLVTSSVVVFCLKHRPAGAATLDLRLRGLEDSVPGLLAWLLFAWPAALYRLTLPLLEQRGGERRR